MGEGEGFPQGLGPPWEAWVPGKVSQAWLCRPRMAIADSVRKHLLIPCSGSGAGVLPSHPVVTVLF